MDFKMTGEQETFRREIQDFLVNEIKAGTFQPTPDAWLEGFSPEFSRKIARQGWIGLTWPRKYGGQERGYLDRLIYTEEVLRYGAPVCAHWPGDRQVGPSLIHYGTEEQREQFLPKIIRGEMFFCLGMSEPESGSDLASLKTRAEEKDDCFIINGQKVWTGSAHRADFVYLVVRTDPDLPKHKGISEFIVDMKTPGIEVRPLVDLVGMHHLNEVYFDNVRVPKSALIGEKNNGWYQIAAQLDYERSGMERLMSNYPVFTALKDFVRDGDLMQNPLVSHKMAELEIEFEVGRLLIYRVAWVLSQGQVPNFESALAKTYGTDFEQKLANTAMEVLGLSGQVLEGPRAALLGMATRSYLFSPGYSIQGGTSEILKTIIATRGLGLPTGK